MTHNAIRPKRQLCQLAAALMFLQSVLPAAIVRADGGGLSGVSGGNVVAGKASIATEGSTLNVNTMTDRTIINWNGFSIGAGETANFFQPGANSAVLNRVTTPNNPTAIFGAMNSNGNVILVNPSGIVVGASGVINTNGFTASTLDIPNNEFLKGGVLNFRGDSTASVINEGTIKTGRGGAALIGGNVINNGTITSEGGSISLATGGSVTLADGSRFTHADMATIESGISSTAGLIRNSGTIRATGAMETGGEVFLVNPGGKIMQDGTIAAYRPGPAGQNGGDVKIAAQGGTAEVGGTIDVSGQAGGSVTVEADSVQVTSATIDASGTTAGGRVSLGGGFQGKDDSIANAKTTSVDAQSVIKADATDRGNGGQVVVWSDHATDFRGRISSTGGMNGGDGGWVEVSGASLAFAGTVDTSAALGNAGWLLLDPVGIRIIRGAVSRPAAGTDPVLTLTDGTLNNVLQFNNVLLATSSTETNAVSDPGGLNQGRGATGPNDDNIVVSQGTRLDTGSNILFFSTSTVDLYSDVIGNVAGGMASNTTLPGLTIKDPTTVNVFDAGNTRGSIQDAVDIVGSGGVVNVGDGVFAGGVVVDKSLQLIGDGYSNTSLIEVASDSAGFTVNSSDVLIDGFRFRGDDGASNTVGVQLGERFRQARNTTIQNSGFEDLTKGIVGRNIDETLTISDIRMRRIAEQGIELQDRLDSDDVVLIQGSEINSGGEAVLFDGSLNGTEVTLRSNQLVSSGADAVRFAESIRLSKVQIGGPGSTDGNRIRGNDDGIDIDGNVSFSEIAIVGNGRVRGSDDAIDLDGGLFLSSVLISDNQAIIGGDDAINFDGLVFLSKVDLINNTRIEAADDGISFRDVALSSIGVTGNRVRLGSTGVGLKLSYTLDSELEIGAGNVFDGGVDGIVINGQEGATLSLVGNTINNTSFSNQSGDYIRLEETALFAPGKPTVIDAKDATFEGLKGSGMTAAQLFATEDKMFHFPDDPSLGLFDISELFVVGGESIQLAVNAAGALGGAQTVVVGQGVFGGSVEVWVDDLTLQGAGDGTVINTDSVDLFANNGDRGNGFEITTDSQIANNFHVDDVIIDGFRFEGSGNTRGIVAGGGFRQARDLSIRNSSFDGLLDGILLERIDGATSIAGVTMTRTRDHGIHVRSSLVGDSVVIADSDINSRGEAVRFDGSMLFSQVDMRGNSLSSRNKDAVHFGAGLTLSAVSVGGEGSGAGNSISAGDDGIEFDGNLEGTLIQIAGNSLIEGADEAIKFDNSVRFSGIVIADNREISGGDNGIQFGGTLNRSDVRIAANHRIEAGDNDAVLFRETISDSTVIVGAAQALVDGQIRSYGGNGQIVGDEDGINVNGIEGSEFSVLRNRRIRGVDGSGIEFDGPVTDDSVVNVNRNESIVGRDYGIEFDNEVVDSDVRIARNELIEGRRRAGVSLRDTVRRSDVEIQSNDAIAGGVNGVEFGESVRRSQVGIEDNGTISGERGSGVEWVGPVRESLVEVLGNRRIVGGELGIGLVGPVTSSDVVIVDNGRLRGSQEAGVGFGGDVEDSNLTIVGNRRVGGGEDGIRFQALNNSLVSIAGNRRIVGRRSAGIKGYDDVRSSIIDVTGNQVIRGGQDGVGVDGALRNGSALYVVRNGVVRGNTKAGVNVEGPVRDSFVGVIGNREVSGGGFGVRVNGNLRNSNAQILGNERLIGERRTGVKFNGTVDQSNVLIAANRSVVGGRNGVSFGGVIEESEVAIAENRRLVGREGSGVRINDEIRNSVVKVERNRNVLGGQYGVRVDGDVLDSRVEVKRNQSIRGRDEAGVAFLGDLRDSKLRVNKNGVRSRRGDGVLIDGRVVESKVRINRNAVRAGEDGLRLTGGLVDSDVRVKRNQIKAGDDGIVVRRVRGDSVVSLVENEIETTGNGSGILLRKIDSSQPVTVEGGSTTGGRFGLKVVQRGRRPLSGSVIVDGLVVNEASKAGMQFKTRGKNQKLEVTLQNQVTVNGGSDPSSVGMVFDGRGLSLTGNTLADTRFVGTPGNFIELRNGGLFAPGQPTLIDGTGVYWDGLDPTVTAQRQIIIDRIIDFLDDPTLGLIFPGASPYLGEQTYDRFTRYEDYFRTIDALMGPYPTGSIRYPMPREEIAEGLGGDEGDLEVSDDAVDQTAEQVEQAAGQSKQVADQAGGSDLVAR